MKGLSVFTIVKNEEKNMQRMFDNLKEIANEFIIVDQESDDRTVDISNLNGAIVHKVPCIGYCEAHYELAKSYCSYDYIMLVFPDEVWDKNTLTTIRKIVEEQPLEDIAYAFRRKEIMSDFEIKLDHPNYQLRLMAKKHAKFCDLIHTSFMFPKKVIHFDDLFFEHRKTREDQDLDETRFANTYKMLILRYRYSKIPWIRGFVEGYKKVIKDFADRGITWE